MFNIFIVEDNALFADTMQRIAKSIYPDTGIRLFSEGKQLLSEIVKHPPHLIFMDINLPDIDGLALTRKIRKINDQATIIVITSYDDPEYVTSAIEAGADGFISKKKITKEEIYKLTQDLHAHKKLIFFHWQAARLSGSSGFLHVEDPAIF